MADAPAVARIVHYVHAGHSLGTRSSTCRAAIITEVHDSTTVSVCVFFPRGQAFYEKLVYDEQKVGASWHWPERVDVPTSSIAPPSRKTLAGGQGSAADQYE